MAVNFMIASIVAVVVVVAQHRSVSFSVVVVFPQIVVAKIVSRAFTTKPSQRRVRSKGSKRHGLFVFCTSSSGSILC